MTFCMCLCKYNLNLRLHIVVVNMNDNVSAKIVECIPVSVWLQKVESIVI